MLTMLFATQACYSSSKNQTGLAEKKLNICFSQTCSLSRPFTARTFNPLQRPPQTLNSIINSEEAGEQALQLSSEICDDQVLISYKRTWRRGDTVLFLYSRPEKAQYVRRKQLGVASHLAAKSCDDELFHKELPLPAGQVSRLLL